MAQPSSSHHRERERSERSRHHHHRTISSTTLLLVLSLVLAVLAVMLSLPANRGEGVLPGDPQTSQGILGYLTPKRTQMLAQRERDVAIREAEVAKREAELLAGAPGGVTPSPQVCAPCPSVVTTEIMPPVQTVIKEVIKEEGLTPPGWLREAQIRAEDILEREIKLAERERDISRREEAVNRREHDASRREAWIMEQIVGLNAENGPTVEEEYIYEPAGAKRGSPKELPGFVVTESIFETKTVTETEFQTFHAPAKTVHLPPPANTRLAASPAPEVFSPSTTPGIPKTTAVQVLVDEEIRHEPEPIEEMPPPPMTVSRQRARKPKSWFGGW
ncbi:hypothetical protein GLOTRDRAFT_110034 [Gloeophyllum trabeum ATCC 11539]|uniref:Uncharacterized protein n=1 Tax=Gloeophyllum trabeum (strain ATCC 11539 / FP-39264 / Madison 617) TaxID=670483 RepID=S7RTU9_GLOTA|nr:uncharacterized protein GLOTRDRAFT_110034 [Gloeophyllum trabeum ATCC 11539]EPQ58115.1 hypothetical protein GLOTRDRAFT_110034 [Gloeophyllum trabeum ATCC 11539]